MIIRTLEEVIGTQREVKAPEGQWISRRLLLADDKMGFSFHETIIFSGTKTHIHYKNHLESVYCVSGNGSIEDFSTGKTYQINPGTIYILDKHDEHYLYGGTEDMRLMCVFSPALKGTEVHDANGVYPSA